MHLSIVKRELKANWKATAVVAIGLVAFTAAGFMKFEMTANGGQLDLIMNAVPRIVQVLMGAGMLSISSPEGFFSCMFMWISMLVYAHSALLGAGILSKEERDKTVEFLLTKPVKRSQIITSKLLSCVFCLVSITLVCYVTTNAVFLPLVKGVDLTQEIALSFLGMFFTQLLFFFVGVCFSTLTKDHKKASLFTTIFLLYGYLSSTVIEMGQWFSLNFLSPFRYFNAAQMIQDGISILYIVFCFGLIVLSCVVTYKRYQVRDL